MASVPSALRVSGAGTSTAPPEARLYPLDVLKLVVLLLLFAVTLGTYFFPILLAPPMAASDVARALEAAYAGAVARTACPAMAQLRDALAASVPASDAEAVRPLALAITACHDLAEGAGFTIFANCLGEAGVQCFASENAAYCPDASPCFVDQVDKTLLSIANYSVALAAAQAALAAAA